MERGTMLLLGAGAAAGVVAWWFLGDPEPGGVIGDVRQVFTDAIGGITRGSRVTSCPYHKTTGVVPCSPATLAAAAGVELEAYSLARAISSEEAPSGDAVKALVAHAINNEARRRGSSITSLVTRAKVPAHSGSYGTQRNIEEGTPG